ncbi:hypothetical protein E1301_Tti006100 [Triplophysa tibetana]|uniref:Bcl-2-modifying factor n=1 Tax=Triplophysa tibetana TaxID=1572043 RepID=A0A5A9NRM0_9TELE|nr:hypothetical protein E1301_Tti006100 [Triplophysa tibetana]
MKPGYFASSPTTVTIETEREPRLMDEDEDGVFGKALQRWPSSHRQIKIKQTETGLQTVGRPPAPPNGMLPCQMHEERRSLLDGNAGLLLLGPPARSPPLDIALRENLQPMDLPAPRPPQSVETLIGQKLQLIGDQFYQDHMMVGQVKSSSSHLEILQCRDSQGSK